MAEWRIYLDDVLINDVVDSFSVTMNQGNYCKELSLNINDPSYFNQFDWNVIPSQPRLKVYIDEGGTEVLIGRFFAERPVFVVDPRSQLLRGIWGRSETAKLGPPFAKKITKTWDTDSQLYTILDELVTCAGLTFDQSYCFLENYLIYGNSLQVTQQYPINIIKNIMTLCGGVVTTDRLDHVVFKPVTFDFDSPIWTIDDSVIKKVSERVVLPDFGNRIKVSATGSVSGYGVTLVIPEPCLPNDGSTATKAYARVVDKDGNPVNDIVVDWSINPEIATLAYAQTNTGSMVIYDEDQRAENSFRKVRTSFPPSRVIGIYSYRDIGRTFDFAAAGVSISSNLIELTGERMFKYCDQRVKITYEVDGVAQNDITSMLYAKGTAEVVASVEGRSAKAKVYVDNPCACPPVLRMFINPTLIKVGEHSQVLLYAEEGGRCAPGGRRVYISERIPKKGALNWHAARLGEVDISDERTVVTNEVEGVSQCNVRMYPVDVTGVWRVDEDGNRVGGNIYQSFSGKIIDLNTVLDTGTQLSVDYTACGAAVNVFSGKTTGTATLVAYMPTTREEPLEVMGTITITKEYHYSDIPDYNGDQYHFDNDWDNLDTPNADWSPPDNWQDTGFGDTGFDGGIGDIGGGYNPDFQDEFGGGDIGGGGNFNFNSSPKKKKKKGKKPTEGGGKLTCFTPDVSNFPSQEALCNRFTQLLAIGCTCEELCENEFSKYGTTQGYDNASYKPIEQLMAEQHPNESPTGVNSSSYWQHYDEMKQDMIQSCIDDCEKKEGSNCEECVIAGPEQLAPGESATYTCSDGTQAMVTMPEGTCGAYETQVGCCTVKIRSTNGKWDNVPMSGTECTESETCVTCRGCNTPKKNDFSHAICGHELCYEDYSIYEQTDYDENGNPYCHRWRAAGVPPYPDDGCNFGGHVKAPVKSCGGVGECSGYRVCRTAYYKKVCIIDRETNWVC